MLKFFIIFYIYKVIIKVIYKYFYFNLKVLFIYFKIKLFILFQVIEKWCRDCINNSFFEFRRLVFIVFEKQGFVKLEKVEIFQMIVDYLKFFYQKGKYFLIFKKL